MSHPFVLLKLSSLRCAQTVIPTLRSRTSSERSVDLSMSHPFAALRLSSLRRAPGQALSEAKDLWRGLLILHFPAMHRGFKPQHLGSPRPFCAFLFVPQDYTFFPQSYRLISLRPIPFVPLRCSRSCPQRPSFSHPLRSQDYTFFPQASPLRSSGLRLTSLKDFGSLKADFSQTLRSSSPSPPLEGYGSLGSPRTTLRPQYIPAIHRGLHTKKTSPPIMKFHNQHRSCCVMHRSVQHQDLARQTLRSGGHGGSCKPACNASDLSRAITVSISSSDCQRTIVLRLDSRRSLRCPY
jgi:hypothetical protein